MSACSQRAASAAERIERPMYVVCHRAFAKLGVTGRRFERELDEKGEHPSSLPLSHTVSSPSSARAAEAAQERAEHLSQTIATLTSTRDEKVKALEAERLQMVTGERITDAALAQRLAGS